MSAKIITLPGIKAKPRKHRSGQIRVPNEHRIKYFTKPEINLLRRTVKNQAQLHLQKGNVTGVREWAAIDILTSAGLRVSEVANLRCGDCLVGNRKSALHVRPSKWGKTRTVQIPKALKLHLKRYLTWKREQGESTGPDAHLFQGQRGPWAATAVSQLAKKWLRHLGVNSQTISEKFADKLRNLKFAIGRT